MKKALERAGSEPWEYAIDALRVDHPGLTEHEARTQVVLEWMRAGNFGPLLALIKRSGVLRGPVLAELCKMLTDGRLVFTAGRRGRPTDPEAAVRDRLVAETYADLIADPIQTDDGTQIRSDDLIRSVASVGGVSEETVRQAITARRKRTNRSGR